MQQCNFKNFDLIYAFFCRFPSWGCPVKLRQCAANKTFFFSLFLSTNSFHIYNPLPFLINSTCSISSTPTSLPAFPNLDCESLRLKNFQELIILFQSYFKKTVDKNGTKHITQFTRKKFLLQLMVDTFIYFDIVCMLLNLYIKLDLQKIKSTKSSTFDTCRQKEKIHYRSYKLQSHPFSLFYTLFILFAPTFKFTDFESPLVLFSWWRNKISWGLLNQLSKPVAQ